MLRRTTAGRGRGSSGLPGASHSATVIHHKQQQLLCAQTIGDVGWLACAVAGTSAGRPPPPRAASPPRPRWPCRQARPRTAGGQTMSSSQVAAKASNKRRQAVKHACSPAGRPKQVPARCGTSDDAGLLDEPRQQPGRAGLQARASLPLGSRGRLIQRGCCCCCR
jgi:hypothetical protein